jgi:hypothetical protein
VRVTYRQGIVRRAGLVFTIVLLGAVRSTAGIACIGDCDGGGSVAINELVRAVSIALGQSAIAVCTAIDTNSSERVEINELVGAVNASLSGCPGEPTPTPPNSHTASPSVTPTATHTTSPTPTATVNQPPALPTASIYRTFPDLPIRVSLNASDPEGGSVQCVVGGDLPAGAAFDEDEAVLTWMPTDAQLGPFYVPYTCTDDATPPASAQGRLTFSVTELDACTIPSCDPATGCTTTLRPLSEPCCAGASVARVIEPAAGCPEGRVLYIGQNTNGFGRMQNCDTLMVRNFEQSGAEVAYNVETRCMNTLTRIGLRTRMDSTAVNHPVPFDIQSPAFLFTPENDGFARRRGYRFPVSGGGPFFDVEGAEANLRVTLTDTAGVTVTEEVRVRLSFTPRPDLPDVDPTPIPTPTP